MQRYAKLLKSQKKSGKKSKNTFFLKKNREKLATYKKNAYLCKRNEELQTFIGIWCNGNTTDSGPVILGSSPSIPTHKITKCLSSSLGDFCIFEIPELFYGKNDCVLNASHLYHLQLQHRKSRKTQKFVSFVFLDAINSLFNIENLEKHKNTFLSCF